MNHTPGPWKFCLNEPLTAIPGHLIKTDDEVGHPIASLWEGGGTKGKPTQIANAKLIAAAPDLLEACKLLVKELEDVLASLEGREEQLAKYMAIEQSQMEASHTLISDAEAAIAKAKEGGQHGTETR